jgi:outer membrane protein, heavy metal efflux system
MPTFQLQLFLRLILGSHMTARFNRRITVFLAASTLIGTGSSWSLEPLVFETAYDEIVEQAYELKIAEAGFQARGAERRQASVYPNPDLTVAVNSTCRAWSSTDNQLFVGLSQLFELGGKRSARMRVADAEQDRSSWAIEIVKCDLFAALLHAFIDTAVAQERVGFAQAQQNIADQTFECITTKGAAGKNSAIEIKKGDIACKSAKLFLAKEQNTLCQTIQALKNFWDCQAPEFDRVSFPLFDLAAPPCFEELKAYLSSNPALAQTQAELAKAWEIVALERSNSIPDVAVQIGVTTVKFTEDPALAFQIDIPIPLFDRNLGNIERASFEHCQAFYNSLNAANHLEKTLRIVYEQWCTAYAQASLIKENILPLADESYQLAELAYKEGKFDYLELLDARTTFFNVKQQYLNAVEDYHHKRVEVLKLTAQCCPDTIEWSVE